MDYSINALSNQSFKEIKTNPDDYAREYANKNGLSLEEAKEELKAKYGEPQKPDTASSDYNTSVFGQYGPADLANINIGNNIMPGEDDSGLDYTDMFKDQNSKQSVIQELLDFVSKILDAIKNGVTFNPGEQNTPDVDLPKPGDPMFNRQEGPQKPGDPQFQNQDGPQKPGDPQSPRLDPEQLKEIPFNVEDYLLE